MLTIFQTTGRASGGFKNWSIVHPSGSNDNDHPSEATPIALTGPPCADREAITESLHQPWLVPGVGTSF